MHNHRLATDVTDATLGASRLWLETPTGAGGTATLTESFFFFFPQPMAPWTTGLMNVSLSRLVKT